MAGHHAASGERIHSLFLAMSRSLFTMHNIWEKSTVVWSELSDEGVARAATTVAAVTVVVMTFSARESSSIGGGMGVTRVSVRITPRSVVEDTL